jgi:hypothetical protein
MPRTVNRAVAARAAGVPYMSLKERRFHGDRPTVAPHQEGKRRAEQWSMPMILAVRVSRILELRFGTPVSAMVTLFNTLWLADENDLRQKFAEGRKFVMVVGRVPAGNALFTAEEIAHNDMLDYEAIQKAGFPLPVGLDIAKEWDKIAAALLLDGLSETSEI